MLLQYMRTEASASAPKTPAYCSFIKESLQHQILVQVFKMKTVRATISKAKIQEIAEMKMPDAASLEAAIEHDCRNCKKYGNVC